MYAETSRENLIELLLWWAVLTSALLFSLWRSRQAAGLPLVYAFWYSVIHVFGAMIYCLPSYTPRSASLLESGVSLTTTYVGFRVATLGFAGFVFGCLLGPLFFPKRRERPPQRLDQATTIRLPGTLLLFGILSFSVIGPVLRIVPSLNNLATPGKSCAVVGVFLFCWQAIRHHDGKRLLLWLLTTFGFPAVTIISAGFASYGALAAATVWMMVAQFYRPRFTTIIALTVMLYGCITLYVNWMGERQSIRDSVWGGSGLSQRFTKFKGIIDNFELFDSHNQRHLELIDARLNQNDLVGKTVFHIQNGRVDFANGGTFYVALVAWIPRILWPGKPVTAGSGNTVTHFTGQKFAVGTSVGIGQALEFYANFGMPGVFLGFLLFGMATRYFDWHAAYYLNQGDFWNFTRWLMPGLALLQPGGMVSEIVGSLALNIVFVVLVHRYLFAQYYGPASNSLQGSGQRGSKVHRYPVR